MAITFFLSYHKTYLLLFSKQSAYAGMGVMSMNNGKKDSMAGRNREMILSGSLLKAILVLAVPIIINSMIQTMYNLTDTFWLGQIGTNPMAAITLVSPIQNIIINFGQGITLAGAILISQYVGAGDKENSNDMANQVFSCSMVFSVICALSCFIATPAIVKWLGAQGEVYKLSRIYLQIAVLDMPFLFMINLYTAVNQAQGNTVMPMYLNFFGIAINMVLDPLFLVVFGWGAAGAAGATLLAKVPCALIAFISLVNPEKDIFINFKRMHFDKKKLKMIIKIGLPTALGGSTMQFGFLLMSRNVLKYGSIAVAAYGIGNRVNGIITMPSNAMGSATATIVGQNLGANQKERAEKAYKLARRIIVIFLFVGGMILSRKIVATPIVDIFSDDPEVIRLGADFLSIMAICCWTNGIYNTTSGLFQGSGHTMVTMMVDATRLWVFRFLTLFICESILNMGVRSIWFSVVISNAISSLILWLLYLMGIWKKDVIKMDK